MQSRRLRNWLGIILDQDGQESRGARSLPLHERGYRKPKRPAGQSCGEKRRPRPERQRGSFKQHLLLLRVAPLGGGGKSYTETHSDSCSIHLSYSPTSGLVKVLGRR